MQLKVICQEEVLWVVTPFCVVVGCQLFRGPCYLHLQNKVFRMGEDGINMVADWRGVKTKCKSLFPRERGLTSFLPIVSSPRDTTFTCLDILIRLRTGLAVAQLLVGLTLSQRLELKALRWQPHIK